MKHELVGLLNENVGGGSELVWGLLGRCFGLLEHLEWGTTDDLEDLHSVQQLEMTLMVLTAYLLQSPMQGDGWDAPPAWWLEWLKRTDDRTVGWEAALLKRKMARRGAEGLGDQGKNVG